ncbi:pyruvate kinase [Syntrophothermus lipocalidus]|uniref:Pyruvate kinase n=1 Tax=Syntrophothermus lipocalidus (strain DSM 12680 / TGB-C1) TaxID=643648 RepID=D7CP24_SYNLT|nr:pyruvate kinase [Syntrophothermus lipocalidus]ADI02459.1 pyruvate kinase [Syntrophothermus lipocalidus DSM 12680]
MRKTKIICTLGPSTDDYERLRALITNGMNVARLNFSHGTYDEHERRIRMVREVARELNAEVGLMLDTKGPEIRTGPLKEGKIELRPGQKFVLTNRPVEGNEDEVQISYHELPSQVKAGDCILIADGVIQLSVLEANDTDIVCQVVAGGVLGERKGINLPGVRTNLPFLSQKDIEDINFGIQQNMDFIAASFVRTADDVLDIRRILEEKGADIDIIAKIESQEGLDNLDDIIKVADGVMVARGDLGVEIPTEEVPLVQKVIIEKCRAQGKPVIIATQMLESMVNVPRPTRAEASDVANAIFEGADAIMLSAETAAGKYPVVAVETMARIARRTEMALPYENMLAARRFEGRRTVTDAISYATCATATDLGASAIVTATKSGHTARMVAKYRPRAPIVATTPSPEVVRKLTLVWGVYALTVPETHGTDQMIETALDAAVRRGLISPGDLVVITAGTPGIPGTTNLLRVQVVGKVLVKGTGIGSRAVTSKARVILDPGKPGSFAPGDIVVAVGTDKDYMPLLEKAGGIITEQGGLTSHAAIVGINLDIPVIVGAAEATRVIQDGETITMDTARGQIYRGQAQVR